MKYQIIYSNFLTCNHFYIYSHYNGNCIKSLIILCSNLSFLHGLDLCIILLHAYKPNMIYTSSHALLPTLFFQYLAINLIVIAASDVFLTCLLLIIKSYLDIHQLFMKFGPCFCPIEARSHPKIKQIFHNITFFDIVDELSYFTAQFRVRLVNVTNFLLHSLEFNFSVCSFI